MVARPFRHEAENRHLTFEVQIEPMLTRMVTDAKRLQQVLKNLLSNAFKFTDQGGVRLTVATATNGWSPQHPVLKGAATVVAFAVTDTGIGIPLDKQKIIFEAFQQADASTSRRFGGTGLGLAISRELANLLGGEIQLHSTPGEGSIFTLYVPLTYVGPAVKIVTGTAEAAAHPLATTFSVPRLPELPAKTIADDRESLQPDEASLLIVEDDPYYLRILVDWHVMPALKSWPPNRAQRLLAWPVAFFPQPSHSMSSCLIWSDGTCSASSSMMRRPGIFPSNW